ncbi:hypothetical protein SNEBB_004124 [Seison nebaliae]|nr:hypothetical protein SNEBB_004124 [Seison nebaliae]
MRQKLNVIDLILFISSWKFVINLLVKDSIYQTETDIIPCNQVIYGDGLLGCSHKNSKYTIGMPLPLVNETTVNETLSKFQERLPIINFIPIIPPNDFILQSVLELMNDTESRLVGIIIVMGEDAVFGERRLNHLTDKQLNNSIARHFHLFNQPIENTTNILDNYNKFNITIFLLNNSTILENLINDCFIQNGLLFPNDDIFQTWIKHIESIKSDSNFELTELCYIELRYDNVLYTPMERLLKRIKSFKSKFLFRNDFEDYSKLDCAVSLIQTPNSLAQLEARNVSKTVLFISNIDSSSLFDQERVLGSLNSYQLNFVVTMSLMYLLKMNDHNYQFYFLLSNCEKRNFTGTAKIMSYLKEESSQIRSVKNLEEITNVILLNGLDLEEVGKNDIRNMSNNLVEEDGNEQDEIFLEIINGNKKLTNLTSIQQIGLFKILQVETRKPIVYSLSKDLTRKLVFSHSFLKRNEGFLFESEELIPRTLIRLLEKLVDRVLKLMNINLENRNNFENFLRKIIYCTIISIDCDLTDMMIRSNFTNSSTLQKFFNESNYNETLLQPLDLKRNVDIVHNLLIYSASELVEISEYFEFKEYFISVCRNRSNDYKDLDFHIIDDNNGNFSCYLYSSLMKYQTFNYTRKDKENTQWLDTFKREGKIRYYIKMNEDDETFILSAGIFCWLSALFLVLFYDIDIPNERAMIEIIEKLNRDSAYSEYTYNYD